MVNISAEELQREIQVQTVTLYEWQKCGLKPGESSMLCLFSLTYLSTEEMQQLFEGNREREKERERVYLEPARESTFHFVKGRAVCRMNLECLITGLPSQVVLYLDFK